MFFKGGGVELDIVEVKNETLKLEVSKYRIYHSGERGACIFQAKGHHFKQVNPVRCSEACLLFTVWMHADLLKSHSEVESSKVL